MALNLSKLYAQIADIKRNLFYDTANDETVNILKFRLDNEDIYTLESGFYFSKNPVDLLRLDDKFPGDTERHKLAISIPEENEELVNAIQTADSVVYNGEIWKIYQYIQPIGITEKYRLLVARTGSVDNG